MTQLILILLALITCACEPRYTYDEAMQMVWRDTENIALTRQQLRWEIRDLEILHGELWRDRDNLANQLDSCRRDQHKEITVYLKAVELDLRPIQKLGGVDNILWIDDAPP